MTLSVSLFNTTNNIFVIVGCSLLLSFGAALGMYLQQLSIMKEEERIATMILGDSAHNNSRRNSCTTHHITPRPTYQQPLFVLGMILLLFDGIGDFIFIGLVPLTILSPLGSLSLGWNVLLPTLCCCSNKPTMTTTTTTRSISSVTICTIIMIYIGTFTTVGSVFLFPIDSSKNDTNTSINNSADKFLEYITTFPFLIYVLLCMFFIMVLFYHGRYCNEGGYGIIHYCGLAGCFGGMSLLFLKSLSELIINQFLATGAPQTYKNATEVTAEIENTTSNINNKNSMQNTASMDVSLDKTHWISAILFSSPMPYLFLILLFLLLFIQRKCLQYGVAKFDGTIMIPIYQIFWNFFGILGGITYFQESWYFVEEEEGRMKYNIWKIGIYIFGFWMTLLGIVVLVKQNTIVPSVDLNELEMRSLHDNIGGGSISSTTSTRTTTNGTIV